MKLHSFLIPAALLASTLAMNAAEKPGYTDTPVITGQKWRVHDAERPQPRTVTPGAAFSHGAPAPSDAKVLFDGTDLSLWTKGGAPAPWKVENGYMEVVGKSGSIETKDHFGSFQLHLEFAAPNPPVGDGQARANSGIFLHGIYEIQVLDGYRNPTYADGSVGSIYGQWPPLALAAKPPGQWQSVDILFEAPRTDQGRVREPAHVTVILNGIVVQHRQPILGPVRHREVAAYDANTPTRGPIGLQDHGDPVRFRNIWIRPLGEHDQP
ncbi:MAG: DUF1080 domain-containing protein [Verrucomicrobiae bacterium]|nr:DUF1080 domain-containing protein [Verrucomicrobiae bacterium]